MASAKSSRKKSWIDWADRTFGSVIHTSFIHLGGGTNARQVRDPLDTSPRPVTLPALWHSPLSSASPTARRKPMKIRPLQDRDIVKRVPVEEKTKDGIIIPERAKENP